MSEDEPKKTPRLPPIPDSLPACSTCGHYSETLVDNEAGAVKGFEYACGAEKDLPSELCREDIHPDSIGCIAHTSLTQNYEGNLIWDAIQLDLEPNYSGMPFNSPYTVNRSSAVKICTQFQEAMAKVITHKLEDTYFNIDGTEHDNPMHIAMQELESELQSAMDHACRTLLLYLEEELVKQDQRTHALIMRQVSNYVESSISDLKRELLGNEEEPTNLMKILGNGEPPSEEFKKMFGLE